MIIKLPIGVLESNCYLVYDEENSAGVIVDPGGDPAALLDEIEKRGIKVTTILNTHGHFDHTAGNAALVSLNAPLAIHPADRALLAECGGAMWFGIECVQSQPPAIELTDGGELEVGRLHIQVLATPGHTPGGVCFYIPEEHALITGDTLFAGSVGRTDLPGGDPRALTESLKRLLEFPPETVVHPGHGPSSTMEQERRRNPWLRWIEER